MFFFPFNFWKKKALYDNCFFSERADFLVAANKSKGPEKKLNLKAATWKVEKQSNSAQEISSEKENA